MVTERERWRPRWDDEEILRGRKRGPDGAFRGKSKGLMLDMHPSDEHAERVKTILREGQQLLQESTPKAILTLVSVMEDDEAPHAARVRAAELILDRVYGKAPQTVNLHMDTPFERLMMGLVLQFTGGTEAQVIDMEQDDGGIIWDD